MSAIDQPVGTAIAKHLAKHRSRTLEGHLATLSDEALSLAHDSLIDNHDAHREFVFGTKIRVEPSLREYFAAVQLEIMCRDPRPRRPQPIKSRYVTHAPIDRLKRVPVHVESNGSCSLADLQRQYWRQN